MNSHLIPIKVCIESLTTLYLFDLSNLEMLDCTGLLHLTSLQQLQIFGCPKLENMAGESLPFSLIKLTIWECPLLEKRCRMKHPQIWPKICHIPGIKVDDRWIQPPRMINRYLPSPTNYKTISVKDMFHFMSFSFYVLLHPSSELQKNWMISAYLLSPVL